MPLAQSCVRALPSMCVCVCVCMFVCAFRYVVFVVKIDSLLAKLQISTMV